MVTLYSFESSKGVADGTFTTFDPHEAKEHGKRYGLRVIANDYEWSDSEVAWDFTGGNDG